MSKIFNIEVEKYLLNKSDYSESVLKEIYDYSKDISEDEVMKIEYTSIDDYKYVFDTYKYNVMEVVGELFLFFDYCLNQKIEGLINPLIN